MSPVSRGRDMTPSRDRSGKSRPCRAWVPASSLPRSPVGGKRDLLVLRALPEAASGRLVPFLPVQRRLRPGHGLSPRTEAGGAVRAPGRWARNARTGAAEPAGAGQGRGQPVCTTACPGGELRRPRLCGARGGLAGRGAASWTALSLATCRSQEGKGRARRKTALGAQETLHQDAVSTPPLNMQLKKKKKVEERVSQSLRT